MIISSVEQRSKYPVNTLPKFVYNKFLNVFIDKLSDECTIIKYELTRLTQIDIPLSHVVSTLSVTKILTLIYIIMF